jgi:hypothetical protein
MAAKGSTGNGVYTEHIAVAVTPEMKEQAVRAGAVRDVKPSVIVRWALADWLAAHVAAGNDSTGTGE